LHESIYLVFDKMFKNVYILNSIAQYQDGVKGKHSHLFHFYISFLLIICQWTKSTGLNPGILSLFFVTLIPSSGLPDPVFKN